jgi:GNAT superfamily N-acetyltransferase
VLDDGHTSTPPDPAGAAPLRVVVNPTLTGALRSHLVDMWARVTNEGGSVGFVSPVTPEDIRPTADRSFARIVAGTDVLVCLVAPDVEPSSAWPAELTEHSHPSSPASSAGIRGSDSPARLNSTRLVETPTENAVFGRKVGPLESPVASENGHPRGRGTTVDELPSAVGSELARGDRVLAWLMLAESDSHLRRHWRTVYRVQVDPARQGAGLGSLLMAAAARYAKDALGLEALTLMTRSGTGAERFYKRCGYREVGRIPGAIRVGPGDDRDEVHFWIDL